MIDQIELGPLHIFLLGSLVIVTILLLSRKMKPSGFYITGPSALSPKHKQMNLECPLIEKTTINHDTYVFRFGLPKKTQVLGLHVGEHIMLQYGYLFDISEQIPTREHPEGELVERKYTPVSLINQKVLFCSECVKGSFDLLIKIYRANEHPRFPNGGKLTSWLDKINLDEKIHITGPIGRLQYRGQGVFKIKRDEVFVTKKYTRIIMIAGGSGITPLYQIIQSIIHAGNDNTKMELLFANKTEADILLYTELKAFVELKKLKLYFTLDNPPENWPHFSGFVSQDMVTKAFTSANAQTICLTCGPGPMNRLAIEHFQSIGASRDNIHEF